MTNNQEHNKLRDLYAQYLRKSLTAPVDWDNNLYGVFPSTEHYIVKYLIFLYFDSTNQDKKNTITGYYKLKNNLSKEQLAEQLKDKGRTIEKFFKAQSTPQTRTSEFIAVIFESKYKTLREFSENHSKPIVTKKSSPSSLLKRVISYALLIVIMVSSAIVLSYSFQSSDLKTQKKDISADSMIELSFLKRIFVGNNLYIDSKEEISNLQNQPNKLIYNTLTICNDYCIYPNPTFPFKVDSNGEDMSSNKYGSPYCNLISPVYPQINGLIPIANKYLDLSFSVTNNTESKYFLESVRVNILNQYSPSINQLHYNKYQNRGSDLSAKVVFDIHSLDYLLNMDTRVLGRFERQKFFLRFEGNTSCSNRIVNFKVIVYLRNKDNQLDSVLSDKTYFLGFYNR